MRMWSVLRRVLLVAIVLVAVAAGGWYLYGGNHRRIYEEKVEALRAAGQPTRFEDLATPPVADGENGAKLLEEAHRILEEREKAPDSAERLFWKDEHTDDERLRIADYLESLAPYFDLLAEVPRRAGWRLDIDWSKGTAVPVDLYSQLSGASRMLVARAEFDLEPDGRTGRAAATALLLLDLGAKCRGPFVIGRLVPASLTSGAVGVLRTALREPGFDAATFRRLVDGRLAEAIPERGPPASVFVEERVFFLACVRALDTGEASSLSGGPDDRLLPFVHRPGLFRDACTCLDLAEEAIRRCDTTPEDALAVGADFAARYPPAREDLVRSFGTLYARVFTWYGEHVAALRLARVVMALLEHRQREGAWPESLAILGDLPADPFSGKPFLYERTERGCTIRSAKDAPTGDLEERNLAWSLDDDQMPAIAR